MAPYILAPTGGSQSDTNFIWRVAQSRLTPLLPTERLRRDVPEKPSIISSFLQLPIEVWPAPSGPRQRGTRAKPAIRPITGDFGNIRNSNT